ncbi:MAG: ABC transporter ATP-binding protein [Clostridia bacterium]|nr:ABC transporter ATP-binding protein [Clostridia bacterium]
MDSPILQVQSLIKQFRQSDSVITAVNRVNFTVESGEFVAIVGASGSGKSTFLQLCAGLMTPNSGSIKILGQEITELSPDKLAQFRGRFLGMIFQKHNLIPQLTAKENIEIPAIMMDKAPSSYEHSFMKLVEALKIKDRLHHLPSELSGGQQQRVAIARALMNRPQILFADEPTGNLDRANADEVLSLLLKMQKDFNQTLIMVTHDESIAQRADRIFKMEDGCLSQISH